MREYALEIPGGNATTSWPTLMLALYVRRGDLYPPRTYCSILPPSGALTTRGAGVGAALQYYRQSARTRRIVVMSGAVLIQ